MSFKAIVLPSTGCELGGLGRAMWGSLTVADKVSRRKGAREPVDSTLEPLGSPVPERMTVWGPWATEGRQLAGGWGEVRSGLWSCWARVSSLFVSLATKIGKVPFFGQEGGVTTTFWCPVIASKAGPQR